MNKMNDFDEIDYHEKSIYSNNGKNISKNNLVKGILASIGVITIFTILSRIIGFARWVAQAYFVGTGSVADAYASANQIPNVLFEVLAGGALSGITIPLLAVPVAKKYYKQINEISSALISWMLIILIPLSVILFLSANWINSILPVSAGANYNTQSVLTILFLKIFAVQIPFYGLGVIFTGILQAHKKFLWPVLAPLFSSIVVIATYCLYGFFANESLSHIDIFSVNLLAWGTTFGVFMLSVPMIIPIYRLGVRFKFTLQMEKHLIKQAFSLGGAGLGALFAQQLAVFVTLFIAKGGGQLGTINIFQYSQAVYVLPYAILIVPIATVVFPYISEFAGLNKELEFSKVCIGSIKVIVFLSLVGITGLIAVSKGVEGIFQNLSSVDGMGICLIAMAPGIIGFGLIFHVSRCLYAINEGFSAAFGTVVGWLAVSIFQIVFIYLFVPNGGDNFITLLIIGVAQTIGMSVAGIILLHALNKKLVLSIWSELYKVILKILPVMFLGFVISIYFSNNFLLGKSILISCSNAFISGSIILLCSGFCIKILGVDFFKPSSWVSKLYDEQEL